MYVRRCEGSAEVEVDYGTNPTHEPTETRS